MKKHFQRIPRAAHVLIALCLLVGVEQLAKATPPEPSSAASRSRAEEHLRGAWRSERETVRFGDEVTVGARGAAPWSVVQADGDALLIEVRHETPTYHRVCLIGDDALELDCPLGVRFQRSAE